MGAYKVRGGNIPASFREIQAISKADITEALAEMHEQGIGISIIHAVDDKVFPMDKVQKWWMPKALTDFIVSGEHTIIIMCSNHYGKAAELALTALEKKKKTPSDK